MLDIISSITSSFSLPGFYTDIKPMILFVIGILVYAVFIFNFYRFVARKDIFKFGLSKYNPSEAGFFKIFFSILLYIIEYLILFPIFTFFWSAIFALLLIFLSKNSEIQQILMIAMALIAVIRATAYYNEELSKDLAKMLPFALLAIFMIDVSFFSINTSIEIIKTLPSNYILILNYLLAVIFLEFVLRILYSISMLFTRKKRDLEKRATKI